MINAVIIEDEYFAIDRLKMLIAKCNETIVIKAELNSIERAVAWLKENEVDLIFMDIHLSDGSSFKIFEHLKITTPIIFTTAHHEYALRAFEQLSIDYLLKPISHEKLQNSLEKFNQLTQSDQGIEKEDTVSKLIDLMKTNLKSQRFMVSLGSKVKVVDLEEIAYFYTENKLSFIVTHTNQKYPLDVSLKQIQQQLDERIFYRVNRQFLIKKSAIKELEYYSPTRILVHTHPISRDEIIVAREKNGMFKRWLLE